jgi:hypothetical protein
MARKNEKLKKKNEDPWIPKDLPRHGYGDLPEFLYQFFVYQYQIGGLIFYCQKCASDGPNDMTFSNVVFYEVRTDIYEMGHQVKVKMWSFYDKMMVKLVGGNFVFAFKPCVFQDVITDMILSEEELKRRMANRVETEDLPEEKLEVPGATSKKRQDPFGRDKVEGDPGVQ